MAAGEESSYRIGERSFRNVSAELERLRVQAEIAWPEELRALRRHGLRDGADLLEAGCGPGFVTALLLEHAEPRSVTALDVDPTMLAHARDLVGESDRVRFVEASATATGLDSDSVDVAVVRFLLQHLPNVEAVLAELRRVLRPGGRLIVVEADQAFDTIFHPEPSFARDLMDAVGMAQRAQGGDRTIGRRLPRLLLEAGFSDVAVDAVVVHSALVGRETIRSTIPDQALDHLQAAGFVSSELAATARDYLTRIDAGDQDFDAMILYLVVSGSS